MSRFFSLNWEEQQIFQFSFHEIMFDLTLPTPKNNVIASMKSNEIGKLKLKKHGFKSGCNGIDGFVKEAINLKISG